MMIVFVLQELSGWEGLTVSKWLMRLKRFGRLRNDVSLHRN